MDAKRFIGCCGAYCKTCGPFIDGQCKGCKLGFDTGERDIKRAKCRIKLCCFRDRQLETCADCPEFESCKLIGDFHGKQSYKYGKYREAIEFIAAHGYARFLKAAAKWKNAYGKL